MTEAEQIEAAKAALDKATPGPWEYDSGSGVIWVATYDHAGEPCQVAIASCTDNNAILIAAAPALVRRVQELEDENKELNDLFNLQWTRSIEADELWRKAHPGNDHVWPDLGKLLTWLLGRIAELEDWQNKSIDLYRTILGMVPQLTTTYHDYRRMGGEVTLTVFNPQIERAIKDLVDSALIEQAEGGK